MAHDVMHGTYSLPQMAPRFSSDPSTWEQSPAVGQVTSRGESSGDGEIGR